MNGILLQVMAAYLSCACARVRGVGAVLFGVRFGGGQTGKGSPELDLDFC